MNMELKKTTNGIPYFGLGDVRFAFSNLTKTKSGYKHICVSCPKDNLITNVDVLSVPREAHISAIVLSRIRKVLKLFIKDGEFPFSKIDSLSEKLEKVNTVDKKKKRVKKRKKKKIVQILSTKLNKYIKIDVLNGEVLGMKKTIYKNCELIEEESDSRAELLLRECENK